MNGRESPFASVRIAGGEIADVNARRAIDAPADAAMLAITGRAASGKTETLARRYASMASVAEVTPTITFDPWLPSRGLITTGRPILVNASAASAGDVATDPSGTGTPATASSCLVRTLSEAMSTPTAEVCSVSAAHTRRRWQPWPSRSRLRLPTRRTGMPRRRAAAASAAVLTPRLVSATIREMT